MENERGSRVTDLSYLVEISKGDDQFIQEMIDVYLRQTPEAIIGLETSLAKQDWEGMKTVAHKLMPSCSFFGLTELHGVIHNIEEYAGMNDRLKELPDMIAKVKRICTQAMIELGQEISAIRIADSAIPTTL